MCDIMRMSHTNYKNVIEGLGGDPMRFLLLLVHTLNVFINKFASGARNFFFDFSMSHCHKRYRSEEISPQAEFCSKCKNNKTIVICANSACHA